RKARLLHRRQRDHRLWRDTGRVRVHRCRCRGDLRRACVCVDGGRARASSRLDVPVRGAAVGDGRQSGVRRLRDCLHGAERNPNKEGDVNVPLLDLVAQFQTIKDEVLPALQAVIESQQFVMGPLVPQLETAVARLAHAKHGIACASGTDALLLPLKALGLRSGDEVITTPFTFFATAGTIHNAGGMMVTSDDALAERLRKLRLHGGAKQYHHDEIGTNSRLDSMQAAVLLAKLPYLAAWSERRREHAATYTNALADVSEVRPPVVDACNEPIFHQYTLRVERRDDLQAHLKSKGVGNAVYYPVPLHLQNCFSDLGYKRGRLPEAERAAGEVISLPIYPELTRDQVDYVADMIRGFYR